NGNEHAPRHSVTHGRLDELYAIIESEEARAIGRTTFRSPAKVGLPSSIPSIRAGGASRDRGCATYTISSPAFLLLSRASSIGYGPRETGSCVIPEIIAQLHRARGSR